MKSSKKMFVLIELALAAAVVVLAFVLIQERSRKDHSKVSVIIRNSEDSQWSAFKYGLKMAAQDQNIEIYIVSIGDTLTVGEEKRAIEQELANGADAVIVQPVPGPGTEDMLKKIDGRTPVMLVEYAASHGASALPVTQPDNYAMGKALAEEMLRDYNGNLDGKTIGIFSETDTSRAVISRREGFWDVMKDTGAKVSWSVCRPFAEDGQKTLEAQPKVHFVAALDDHSLTIAGECSAANNLHGALVYGIGHSTEAVYYLDTGFAECLIVPDEFNVGYQSLTEITRSLKNYFYRVQDQTVSFAVIRRDELFSKENQDILFTMSQ